MLEIIKKNVYTFFGKKVIFFLILLVLYTLVMIHTTNGVMSQNEIMIIVLTNRWFISFIELPICLLLFAAIIERYNGEVVIRCKNMENIFFSYTLSVMLIVFLFVTLEYIFVYMITLQNCIQSNSYVCSDLYDSYGQCKDISILQETIKKPICVIIINFFYKCLGYVYIGLVVYIVDNIMNKKKVFFLCVFLFCEIVISLRINENIVSALNIIVLSFSPNTYVSMGVGSSINIRYLIVCMILQIIILILGGRRVRRSIRC